MNIHIRLANRRDRDELKVMQALAMRSLAAAYYDDEVIEAFIAGVGTMDEALIDDGTYFAAVAADGRVAGCGGWSLRTPNYATTAVDVTAAISVTKATVRSVYVHPAFARRGIAKTIMTRVEAEIAAAGFVAASLTATLSGVPLYRSLRYRAGNPIVLTLGHGLTFVGLGMEKSLVTSAHVDRSAA